MKLTIKTIATLAAFTTLSVPYAVYAGSIKDELVTLTPSDTSEPTSTCTECDQKQNARLGALEDQSKNYADRIDVMEKDTVRQPALENESNARNLESQEREKGDRQLNERTDEAFGVLANHEGRIVNLENSDKAQSDKIQWLDKSHMEDHVRMDAAEGNISTLKNDTQNLTKLAQAEGFKLIDHDKSINALKEDNAKTKDSINELGDLSNQNADDIDNLKVLTNKNKVGVEGNTQAINNLKTQSNMTTHRAQDNTHRIDGLTDTQKADHDKLVFLDERHVDTANRVDGLDRKTDQTANDASYAKGKADYLDAEHVKTNAQVYNHEGRIVTLENADKAQNQSINDNRTAINNVNTTVNTQGGQIAGNRNDIDTLQSDMKGKASTASVDKVNDRVGNVENRVTVNEGRTTRLENGAAVTNRQVNANTQGVANAQRTGDQALKVGNTAYNNTVVNSARLDGHDADIQKLNGDVSRVDRSSRERAEQVLNMSKEYTDETKAQLTQQMDKIRREEQAGIAGVAAIAGMPMIPGVKLQSTFGVGNFHGSTAVATGLIYQPSATDAFKAAASLSNGGSKNTVVSVGMAHAW